MSRFSKLRELVTLARTNRAEARRMHGQPKADRNQAAEGYEVQALHMAGRNNSAAYGEYMARGW